MSDIPVFRMWANRFLAFLAGTGAALVVYCVFLVRHMDLVSTHIDGLEAGGKIIMAACLFGIALASGIFTATLKPRTLGGAFTMGLALPALIFAMDVGIGGSADKDAGPARAAALILSPVSTVARLERADLEKGMADAEGDLEQLREDQQQIGDRADRLDAELKIAVEERGELKRGEEILRTERDEARTEATRLRDDLSTSAAMVDELQKELKRRPPALPIRVTVKADPETVRAGASTAILVTARTEAGDPVVGAAVKVEAEAGSFGGMPPGPITSVTDAAGTFRAVWKTGPVGQYPTDTSHGIVVEVTKPGHVPERVELSVKVEVAPPPDKPVPVPADTEPPDESDPPGETVPEEQPTKPEEPALPAGPMGMVAAATAEPGTIAAGGSTTIRVTARMPDGKPIEGATVWLGTTGGKFENQRGGRITGVTDAEGIFRALWRTLPAELYASGTGYEFRVRVEKEGHVWAKAKTTVRVMVAKPRRPIPLLAWEHADPSRLLAGGTSMITVTAKTPTGLPIPGATVHLGAPVGTFEDTNADTTTGVTDEKGAFRVRWRTGPSGDYDEDRPFDMTVEVTKAGYDLARSEMRIEVLYRGR